MTNYLTKWTRLTRATFVPEKKNSPLPLTYSVAQEVRFVTIFGDIAVFFLTTYGAYRLVRNYFSGVYRSKNSHLPHAPPVLLAEEFSFTDFSRNRAWSTEELEQYRKKLRSHTGPIEKVFFE